MLHEVLIVVVNDFGLVHWDSVLFSNELTSHARNISQCKPISSRQIPNPCRTANLQLSLTIHERIVDLVVGLTVLVNLGAVVNLFFLLNLCGARAVVAIDPSCCVKVFAVLTLAPCAILCVFSYNFSPLPFSGY